MTDTPSSDRPPEGAIGLARFIAKKGYASRRQAGEIVRSGRVQVDGKRISDPNHTVTPESEIVIDGRLLREVIRVYYAFHKPLYVVTSATVTQRAELVSSFLPDDIAGLRSAGRMDSGTSGLLLISNDSQWNSLAAGGNGWDKEFLLDIEGQVNESHVGLILGGVQLPKIGRLQANVCEILESSPERSRVRFAMYGGKIRQIKTLFSSLHLQVKSLHRLRIGPVELGVLQPGKLRLLSNDEVEALRSGCQAISD